MDFRTATDGIPAEELARAFRVGAQTVRQYRLDPSASGYRSPPAGWESIVARLRMDRGDTEYDIARTLAADSLDP